MAVPALWECKSANAKNWREIAKHGVTKAKPVYAAQIALYQAYLGLTEAPALFTAINKDTCEIWHELVPFDAALAQSASDKAVTILRACDAGELLPAPHRRPRPLRMPLLCVAGTVLGMTVPSDTTRPTTSRPTPK
jgi:hypothetical protein